MTPSEVCFGAKDDAYGSFKIPASGSIITFKLIYRSGSVSCQAKMSGYKSNWGCKYQGYSTHPMGTHITDSNKNRLLSKDKYLVGDYGFYNLPWATPDSPELLFDNFSNPLVVTTGQEFQVWFSEDLFDYCGETDNGLEKTCAVVYGLYV